MTATVMRLNKGRLEGGKPGSVEVFMVDTLLVKDT